MVRRMAQGIATVVAAILAAAPAGAQEKPTLTPADYGRWETLGRAQLSPDGGWLAYDIRRVDQKDELRVRALDEDSARVVPFGSDATFSNDGRWLAYAIGLSPEQEKDDDARESTGLLDLRARRDTTFEGATDFDFSDDGAYLALYREGSGEDEAGDLVVHDLATGAEVPLGNVDSWAWSPTGHLLAATLRTASGSGGGVQLFDPGTGTLRVLDRSDTEYAQLTWREDDDDLAVLRARSDEGFDEDTQVVLVWRDLSGRAAAPLVLDPDAAPGFPEGMRIADSMEPEWSADGRSVFIGLRPRERSDAADEATEADSLSVRRGGGDGGTRRGEALRGPGVDDRRRPDHPHAARPGGPRSRAYAARHLARGRWTRGAARHGPDGDDGAPRRRPRRDRVRREAVRAGCDVRARLAGRLSHRHPLGGAYAPAGQGALRVRG